MVVSGQSRSGFPLFFVYKMLIKLNQIECVCAHTHKQTLVNPETIGCSYARTMALLRSVLFRQGFSNQRVRFDVKLCLCVRHSVSTKKKSTKRERIHHVYDTYLCSLQFRCCVNVFCVAMDKGTKAKCIGNKCRKTQRQKPS